jgi:hypothetical protein
MNAVALLSLYATSLAADDRAPSGDVDRFLDEWSKKAAEIRTLSIRFRQEKTLKVLRRPRLSDGDLAYADGKLSVIVRSPAGEVETELLMARGELKILYPRLKRLEVIPVGAGGPGPGMGPAMPFFGGDPRAVTKDYDATLTRSDGKDVLALRPKDPRSPLKKLEMTFVSFEVREYRQVDADGSEVHMTITSAEVNKDVPASRFELKVPEGTVTVRPAGGKDEPQKAGEKK